MKHYQQTAFMDQYPLSPLKPIKKTLFSTGLAFIGAIFLLLSLNKQTDVENLSTSFVLFFLISIALIGIIFAAYHYWYYKTYFYNLTEEYLIIRKGPIAPHEITIPLYRIQDVYVDQDILDRIFGIYDVHFSTATATSGVSAHIDGVDRATAEKLREIVLSKLGKK